MQAVTPAFGSLMDRYPLFNFDPFTNNGHPFCRNQFFSPVKFRDLAIYSEVFRPLGIDNHCATYIPTVPSQTVFFGIERKAGPDFTGDELLLLRLAQDHLHNAWTFTREVETAESEITIKRLIANGLTGREADTLFWITEGKSNAEIATILGLRLNTVKEYVSAVFDKTGASNRHAAIAWAHRVCRLSNRKDPDLQSFSSTPALLHR